MLPFWTVRIPRPFTHLSRTSNFRSVPARSITAGLEGRNTYGCPLGGIHIVYSYSTSRNTSNFQPSPREIASVNDGINDLSHTIKNFTLPNKVAVVTGGARGLGLHMAKALAESGASGIALMDVKDDLRESALRELAEYTGVDVTFHKTDICDETSVSDSVRDIVDYHGKIDILINSAGIADSNIKAESYSVPAFRRLVDINLTGSFLIAQACALRMIAQHTAGSIIFIASMSGQIVNYPQEQCAYNASKAGVVQLTKSLAAEWAKYNIRVNAISPGYMDTQLNRVPELDAKKKIWMEQTPQKRLGGPDELNSLAVYLASNEASGFMTGSNLVIDGGYTVW